MITAVACLSEAEHPQPGPKQDGPLQLLQGRLLLLASRTKQQRMREQGTCQSEGWLSGLGEGTRVGP